MSIMLTDAGATQILNCYFKKITPVAGNNFTLKLFVNDVEPSDAYTSANYTEAVGGGYAAKTLLSSSFTVSTVNGIAQAAYETQMFVFTGALTDNATIYGYYVVDDDGVLIYSEALPIPLTIVAEGDMCPVTPAIPLSHGTCS